MAVNDRAIRAFIERWKAMQDAMRRSTDANAVAAGKLVAELSAELFRIVATTSNGTGAAIAQRQQIEAILAQMDEAIAQTSAKLGTTYRDNFAQMWAELQGGMGDAVAGFGKADASKLRAAAQAFRVTGLDAQYQNGFRTWRDNFARLHGEMRSVIEEKLFSAELNGWDQARTARELIQTGRFSRLGLQSVNSPRFDANVRRLYTLGGTLDEGDALVRRAQAIVRTESTKVRNASIIAASEEAGYDKFVNVNEDPVSDMCKRANTLGPLTLDEWASKGGGVPPRHPNCDSTLAPWVDAAPKVSEAEYQAAVRALDPLAV